MKRKNKYKSVITQRIYKSLRKLGVVFMFLFFALGMTKVQGTNSFFTDSVSISGNTFSAGYWIPTIHMTVNPSAPDGENGFYKTTPCVTLSADINDSTSGITIYYKFSDDGNPVSGGTVYPGVCIPIPDGDPTHFEAQAVNNENSSWRSAVVSRDFKVNTAPPVRSGDVVINEVMWMGSKDAGDPSYDGPNDQWIELKNVSNHDIHISDWYLTYKSNSGNELKLLEIPDNRIIKKGEFYLATHYTKNNSAIDVGPDTDDMKNFDFEKFQIKLYTGSDKVTLVDTAGDGTQEPTKGDKDHFYSMERNNTPGDGSNYANWYTCLDASSTGLYWDRERTERGTPGHVNLSKNDPTSPDYDPSYQEPEVNADVLALPKTTVGNTETNEKKPDGGGTPPSEGTNTNGQTNGTQNPSGQTSGANGASGGGNAPQGNVVNEGAGTTVPKETEKIEPPKEEVKPEPEPKKEEVKKEEELKPQETKLDETVV